MTVQDIDDLKILKYLTQVIESQDIINYMTSTGSKELLSTGLLVKKDISLNPEPIP